MDQLGKPAFEAMISQLSHEPIVEAVRGRQNYNPDFVFNNLFGDGVKRYEDVDPETGQKSVFELDHEESTGKMTITDPDGNETQINILQQKSEAGQRLAHDTRAKRINRNGNKRHLG